ncbi:MAG: hypothetical protein AAB465_01460, partial [Patescibacteria group bacterium]
KDIESIEDLFEEADIYVPEAYAWTTEQKKYLEDLSQKKTKIHNYQNSALIYLSSLIYNSKKPIIIADISEEDKEIINLNDAADEAGEQALDLFAKGKFSEAIQKARLYVVNSAKADLLREEEIKKNLEKEIKKILDNNPDYRHKKELKILISLGSIHTHLYKDLKSKNINISRSFSQFPQIYLSIDEAIRKLAFGQECDDELLARSFIEDFLSESLKKLTKDTNKLDRLTRKLSSQLNISDIREISENSGKNSKSEITEELRSRGIRVPRSEKEIDEMLGINKEY